jgi:hypothetical protein
MVAASSGRSGTPSSNGSGISAVRCARGSGKVDQVFDFTILFLAAQDNVQRAVREGPLQPRSLRPRRAKPCLAFLRRREDSWHRLRVENGDFGVRLSRQEAEQIGGHFAFPDLPDGHVQRVQMPAKSASGRSSSKANQIGCFDPPGDSSFSEKLVKGTRHRLSGPSHLRQ